MRPVVLRIILLCMVSAGVCSYGKSGADVPIAGETVKNIDSSIWYVFQAANGDYWFGSNGNGLYRYSGRSITHFTTKHGLCNDQIRGIQQDSAGALYFNTVSGISRYDGKTFTTLQSIDSEPYSGWALHPGDLWFQGAQDVGVIYRYDGISLYRLKFPKTKAYEDFVATYPRSKYPNMLFSPYDVYGIYRDSKGNMWFGTNIGLCRYNGTSFDWMTEQELGIDDVAFHVRSIIEDRQGSFWFTNIMHRFIVHPDGAAEKGTVSYSRRGGLVSSKDHYAAYFLSGIEDGNGHLWLVTYNKGVWRYDGKKLTRYEVKANGKDVTLFTIYKDRSGTLWLGSHNTGAYKFNGKAFVPFRP